MSTQLETAKRFVMADDAQPPHDSTATRSPSSSQQISQIPVYPSTSKLPSSSPSLPNTSAPFTVTTIINSNSTSATSAIATTATPSLMGIAHANDTRSVSPTAKQFQRGFSDTNRAFESTEIGKKIASSLLSQRKADQSQPCDPKQRISLSLPSGESPAVNQCSSRPPKTTKTSQASALAQTPTHISADKPLVPDSNSAVATRRDNIRKNPGPSSTPAPFPVTPDLSNRLIPSPQSPSGNGVSSHHATSFPEFVSNKTTSSLALPASTDSPNSFAHAQAIPGDASTIPMGEVQTQSLRSSHAASAGVSTVAAPSEFSAGPPDDTELRAPANTPIINTKRPMTSSAKNSPSVQEPPAKILRASHSRAPVSSKVAMAIDTEDATKPVNASRSGTNSHTPLPATKAERPSSTSDATTSPPSTAAVDQRKNTAKSLLSQSTATTEPLRLTPLRASVSAKLMPSKLQSSSTETPLTSKPQKSEMTRVIATEGPAVALSIPKVFTKSSGSSLIAAPDQARSGEAKLGATCASEPPQRAMNPVGESKLQKPSTNGNPTPTPPTTVGPSDMELDDISTQNGVGPKPMVTENRLNTLGASDQNCKVDDAGPPNGESLDAKMDTSDDEEYKVLFNTPGCPQKGDKVSGFVETSTRGGHRVFAQVRGQRMVGWVIPVGYDEDAFDGDLELDEERLNGTKLLHQVNNVEDKDTKQAPHPSPRSVFATEVPRRSVIIIGAGMAGIAAARALKDRGFEVVVLEARGRIGGRIATDWSLGSPVELGACFIHGSFGNPLALVAREAALRTYVPSDVDNLFYSNGTRVSSAEDQEAEEVWRALTNRAERLAENVLQKREVDMSLGALLRKLSKTLQNRLSRQVEQLLSWHASNLEMACAADLDDLSATHYDMDVHHGFSGPHEVVRDGYSSVVHALARNLDVRLNTVVKAVYNRINVQHSSEKSEPDITDPTVESASTEKGPKSKANGESALAGDVKEKDGTAPTSAKQVRYLDKVGKSAEQHGQWYGWKNTPRTTSNTAVRVVTEDGLDFTADWCVITVPLGVLQSGDIKFDPPLPQWKQDSIERIGFGVVNKVVLRFDSAFWTQQGSTKRNPENGESKSGINGGGGVDANDDHGSDLIGRVADKHGVFTMFLSMVRITGAPILVGITAGKFAEFVEGRGDEEVAGMAVEALRAMYGRERVGRLLDWRVTRWATDRFSRGSYSYARVGSTPADYSRMSTPVDRVLFAGEATHRKHPATAHGAFMSGMREAARIVRLTGADGEVSAAERKAMLNELALMEEPHASASTDTPKRRKNSRSSWRR